MVEASNIFADFTCTLGTNTKKEERHGFVEFTDYERARVRVVTNLREMTV